MRGVLAVVVFALLTGLLCADEAVQSDGRRIKGALSLQKTGKLQFTPADKKEPASLDLVSEIRLDGGPPPVFRGTPAKVLHLPGGQQLSGVFLGLQKDNLLLRTAWVERLAVPRSAAVALTHQPGARPVFVEDFQGKLSAWSVQGEPKTRAATVLLSRPGQSLAWAAPASLTEGRIGVNFRAEGALSGGRWQVELKFSHEKSDRLVRVTVAGDKTLTVDSGGLTGTSQTVAHSADWRRLVIDFSAGSLRIRCDDDVLWYTLASGPGGTLREVRISCTVAPRSAPFRGSVAFTDFVVERAVSEQRRPRGEPEQDELWLLDGDQVFGRVVRADRQGVDLKGRFGTRRFAWTALRGWFLKRDKPAVTVGRGPVVRLWLRTGLGPSLDVVEGNLTALDARQLTLHHPLLGALVIPRAFVARLRQTP